MNFKRLLVLLLCLWLPLQVSASNMAGCNLVKAAIAGSGQQAMEFMPQLMPQLIPQGHCEHAATQADDKVHHHAECNYCKSHCANSIIVLADTSPKLPELTRLFSAIFTQHYFSVYLDQPQRPPQQPS